MHWSFETERNATIVPPIKRSTISHGLVWLSFSPFPGEKGHHLVKQEKEVDFRALGAPSGAECLG